MNSIVATLAGLSGNGAQQLFLCNENLLPEAQIDLQNWNEAAKEAHLSRVWKTLMYGTIASLFASAASTWNTPMPELR